MSNLGYNPDESAKRLGDGFYEQKLIQQAMVARTGQRFIDGQDSNEKLFKHLMDNAIQSKQQLDLSVGVTLTSEQVAALTHDIVWLESHEVNGEQVLVPVLYLAHSNNRLAPNGALIAGNDLNLIAGKNLDNAGTLRATNNLSAQAGQHLINSGLVESGNRLDLLAGNTLVNKAGGIIIGSTLKSGTDLTLKAGRDINLASAEQLDNLEQSQRNRKQTLTQFGSTVDAGRDLKAEAGRDITAIASEIEAARDITMAATENLTIASAADEQHSYNKGKKVTRQEDHVKQVGTGVKAGGDVRLDAGNNLMLISSRVEAGDEAYLVAGDKLELLAAQDSDYSLYDMKKKGSWGKKKTQRDEVTQVTNVGSEIKTGGSPNHRLEMSMRAGAVQ